MCDLTNPIFTDADKAREHLEAIRWPNGAVCVHCGGTEQIRKLEGKGVRKGLYYCNDCQGQFTATVGTVFEHSKIPLNKWVLAFHLMCASKKGISAHQLHRMLGITYKTAWFMAHRIREAMTGSAGPLGGGGGVVEADETFWGGSDRAKGAKNRKHARNLNHKQKVIALVERNGKVRSTHVAKINGRTLKSILFTQMSSDAHLMTDENASYKTAGKFFASHQTVNHGAGEYARGNVTTNTIEGVFSIFKRGLIGTFHHVGPQHLQRYADEFDFRYNHRTALGFTDKQRAELAIKGADGKRLTYRRTEGPTSAAGLTV